MPQRCVIYLRVSTAEQAAPGHHSLDAQEQLCRRYADSNGYHVVEVLRDEGYSGRTTNRPGLRRLIEYTSKQPPSPIQTILVQDTSRMGRDTTEYLLFRRQLRERGIELVAVAQPNIDSSPEGRLVDTILAGINQYQSEEKGRRVSIAMLKKFDEGWWPSWAPLGYRHVEHDGKKTIEPDPQWFPLVTLAFHEYATGQFTQSQLRSLLTKEGLRDRNGRSLSRTSFNQLLANPFYWGHMRWGGQERMGRHEPVTDQRTWERCQAITAVHNRHAPRSRRHAFLLTGLARCGACKSPLTHSVVSRKGNRYYHCPSRERCSQPYVPQQDLDAQVAALMHDIRVTPDFVEQVIVKVQDVRARQSRGLETQRSTHLRRKAVLEQQRDAAEEKLLSHVLTNEAFQRQMARVLAALDAVNRRIEDVDRLHCLDSDTPRQMLVLARTIPRAYDQASQPLQRRYLRFFFREFVVLDRSIARSTPTEILQFLVEMEKVRTTKNWLPSLDVVRTVLSAPGRDDLFELLHATL